MIYLKSLLQNMEVSQKNCKIRGENKSKIWECVEYNGMTKESPIKKYSGYFVAIRPKLNPHWMKPKQLLKKK